MAERVLELAEINRYLALIRSGEGLIKAARRCGLEPRLVRAARRDNPEFDEMVRTAELEAAEPVESALYKAATVEEAPWAIKLWLERRSSDRWAEAPKVVKHEHTIDAAPGAERLLALQARLEQRQQMLSGGPLPLLEIEAVADEEI